MRSYLSIFIQLLLVLSLSSSIYAEDNVRVKKAVYDLKTGDIEELKLRLTSAIANNSTYYEEHFEELKVKVVIHGNSYKFFINNSKDPKIQEVGKRLKSLYENYDVSFEICAVGLKKMNISEKNVYSFVKIVPNATMALIDAQNDGYAYLPLY